MCVYSHLKLSKTQHFVVACVCVCVLLQSFSLLGSTGSIGTQTLDIIAEHPEKFKLTAMAAGSNVELLAKQVRACVCVCVCVCVRHPQLCAVISQGAWFMEGTVHVPWT